MYMFFLVWRFQKRLEHYSNMKGPFYGGEYSRCSVAYRARRLSASASTRKELFLASRTERAGAWCARAVGRWTLTETLFFGCRILQCLSRCPIVERRSVAIVVALPSRL